MARRIVYYAMLGAFTVLVAAIIMSWCPLVMAQEARENLPEGFTDTGVYDYGLVEDMLVVNVEKCLLKDKTLRIPFGPVKQWPQLSASYLEDGLREILQVEGVADFACTAYQLAFIKAPRFQWDVLTPKIIAVVEKMLNK